MPKVTPLKLAIVASGMTGLEVAAKIDRHVTEVYRWANDARPCPEHVRADLARTLNTTLERLWPDETREVAA
jgi:NADH dehydrogenase FAD-containing subunit